MKEKVLKIYSDGASRKNPGPAASAFVAFEENVCLKKESLFLGVATNNLAEYKGLLMATEWVLKNNLQKKYDKIFFYLDSELVVKQLTKKYKLKSTKLRPIYVKAESNLFKIKNYFLRNIPRSKNEVADRLVNEILDFNEN